MDDEKFDRLIALEGECEIWTRAFDNNGYPVYNEDGTKRTAHRYAYRREYGTVPPLLHNTCGDKRCVNPQHYEPGRKSRTDTPVPRASMRERFHRKTHKDGDCLVWDGVLDVRSRGRIWVDGVMRQAHRVAWYLAYGYEPSSLYRKPECRFRECVNPKHYQEGRP